MHQLSLGASGGQNRSSTSNQGAKECMRFHWNLYTLTLPGCMHNARMCHRKCGEEVLSRRKDVRALATLAFQRDQGLEEELHNARAWPNRGRPGLHLRAGRAGVLGSFGTRSLVSRPKSSLGSAWSRTTMVASMVLERGFLVPTAVFGGKSTRPGNVAALRRWHRRGAVPTRGRPGAPRNSKPVSCDASAPKPPSGTLTAFLLGKR